MTVVDSPGRRSALSSIVSGVRPMPDRRPPRPAHYELTFHPAVETDLSALDAEGLVAAEAILDDLAHGRVKGKLLGERHVSGDLTGLARIKFDDPDQRPPRFRVVYRRIDDRTLDIIAIGVRDQHRIYQAAASRLPPPRTPVGSETSSSG